MVKQASNIAPDPAWATPAENWLEVLERYATLLQVPAWRASVKQDGTEKKECLTGQEARELQRQMEHVLTRLLGSAHLSAKPSLRDLERLWRLRGRTLPRAERCPTRLQVHFQRAALLDAAGYACPYCRRTAWGVYSEDSEHEPRRTLRFEVDHRETRRRLKAPDTFDPKNLVAACRSCNVIKAEMSERRFRAELRSLSRSVAGCEELRH
jgi:5-methylcytosine-specific restriction endonuclease McrA